MSKSIRVEILKGNRERGILRIGGQEVNYRFRTELLKNISNIDNQILLGKDIFRHLFSEEKLLNELNSYLERDEHVVLEIVSDIPGVLSFPFEFIYHDDHGFLCKSGKISIIRHISKIPKFVETRKVRKVKILFLISLPLSVYERQPIDPLTEVEKITQVLGPYIRDGLVELYVEERANFKDVKEALEREKYDIIHFTGHGTDKRGLVFEDEEDMEKEKVLTASELKNLFTGVSPSLLILDACNTAATESLLPPLAEELYRILPSTAVIGTLSTISDSAATSISTKLYEEIFKKGKGFSEILTISRLSGGNEWWKPVLFCPFDSGNRKIFEIEGGEKRKQIFNVPEDKNLETEYVYRYRPVRETTKRLLENSHAVLHGIGGAGKSVLARYIAKFLKGRFEKVLYYSLSEDGEAIVIDTPEKLAFEILKELRNFGVFSVEDEKELSEKVKEVETPSLSFLGVSLSEEEKRAERLRVIFSFIGEKLGKDTLLIIDNLESKAQDESGVLLPEWRTVVDTLLKNGVKVLMTSRLTPFRDSRNPYTSITEIGEYKNAEILFLIERLLERGEKRKATYLGNKAGEIKIKVGFHPLTVSKLLMFQPDDVEAVLKNRKVYEEDFKFDFYRHYFDRSREAIGILFNLPEPFAEEFLVSLLGSELFYDLKSKLRILAGEKLYSIYRVIRSYFREDYRIDFNNPKTIELVEKILEEAENFTTGNSKINVLTLALCFYEVSEKAREFVKKYLPALEDVIPYSPEIFAYCVERLPAVLSDIENEKNREISANVKYAYAKMLKFLNRETAKELVLSAIEDYERALEEREGKDRIPLLGMKANAGMFLFEIDFHNQVRKIRGEVERKEKGKGRDEIGKKINEEIEKWVKSVFEQIFSSYNEILELSEDKSEEALMSLNNRANARQTLAQLYMSTGKWKEAEEELKKAIEDFDTALSIQLRPDWLNNRAIAKQTLAQLYMSTGRTGEAEEYFCGASEDSRKAYELTKEGNSYFAFMQIGRALLLAQKGGIKGEDFTKILCDFLDLFELFEMKSHETAGGMVAFLVSNGFSISNEMKNAIKNPACRKKFELFANSFNSIQQLVQEIGEKLEDRESNL